MKKIICAFLAVLMIAGIFIGCGNVKNETPDTPENPGTEDTPDTPESSEYPNEVNLTPQQQAIVAVAEAYYNRGSYLQYDDTRLVSGNAVRPTIYRWELSKNSPEDATSQYACYTNCAAFAHDVYLEAFDFDIVAWYVNLFHEDLEMRVFYHTVTGEETEEEKANIVAEFKASLEVGDVINCYHKPSGAHTLVYVGGGKILHSAVPEGKGGNYDYEGNREKWESNGSIDYTTVDDMFTEDNKYYLWDEKSFSIARPLKKFPQMQVSEKTRNRMDNLKDIVVQMTSSHPGSITADLGEEITYTFSLKNIGETEAVLDIEDTVPSGSTYVSGGDKLEGDKVTFRVNVPAGETVKVSYKVKVNDDASLYNGGYIFSENAKVGGVSVRCRPVYVGKHLSKTQQNAVVSAAEKVQAGSLKGTDLAEKIYEDAGIEISLGKSKTIMNGLFKAYKTSKTHKEINESNLYVNMIAPTMYGGYFVADTDRFYSRTRGMRGYELMVGDILIRMEGTNVETLMYLGSKKLMDLDNGQMVASDDVWKTLMGTVGFDMFVILRPAME